MDVRPVGATPAGADLSLIAGRSAAAALNESLASLIQEMSQPDLARLIAILDGPASPQNAAQIENLLRSANPGVSEALLTAALADPEGLAARIAAGPATAQQASAAARVTAASPLASALSAGAAPSIADSATALIRELSQPDLARLMSIIDRPPAPADAARLDNLLRAAFSAAAEGDATEAVNNLAEFAMLAPMRAAALPSEPGLAPIQANVEQLLQRLGSVTKVDAEGRLAQAAQLVETSAPKRLPAWDTTPQKLMLIADQIFDAGGYGNYVRAGELAQVVIDGCRWVPAAVPPYADPAATRRDSGEADAGGARAAGGIVLGVLSAVVKRMPARVRVLWTRAPLLVLLLAWFALGLAGGLAVLAIRNLWPWWLSPDLTTAGFDAWGLGFLALVGFGFYMRIRNVRF